MKAIALVVVSGGVAEVYEPEHVDVRVVDLDYIAAGEEPCFLPAGVGFEALVERTDLVEGKDYTWEQRA